MSSTSPGNTAADNTAAGDGARTAAAGGMGRLLMGYTGGLRSVQPMSDGSVGCCPPLNTFSNVKSASFLAIMTCTKAGRSRRNIVKPFWNKRL
jgi:hypothetical protein